MPKLGMRPIRRDALISATIATLGEEGSLDVRMSDIARKAGVSVGLAHHYFDSKDDLFDETMRHLLVQLGAASAGAQRCAKGPWARIEAILETSFSVQQFDHATIAAWLIFYVRALKSRQSDRLLHIYTRRLRSNLAAAIAPLVEPGQAHEIAEETGALIDGLWLRAALGTTAFNRQQSMQVVRDFLRARLGREM